MTELSGLPVTTIFLDPRRVPIFAAGMLGFVPYVGDLELGYNAIVRCWTTLKTTRTPGDSVDILYEDAMPIPQTFRTLIKNVSNKPISIGIGGVIPCSYIIHTNSIRLIPFVGAGACLSGQFEE